VQENHAHLNKFAAFTHLLEHIITSLMSIKIIESFERINIEDTKTKRRQGIKKQQHFF
jgi:hypothetical protein